MPFFRPIERDLNQHRLGTFRIDAKDMSFKWADRDNRALNRWIA